MGRQVEGGDLGAPRHGGPWSAGDKVAVVPPASLMVLLSACQCDRIRCLASLCARGDISLLLPTGEGSLGSNEQPGRWHSWTDRLERADLEGMCHKLAEEDMPAALPAQGLWKGSL